MQWTNGQKTAIETINKNALVSAAAGSGKTAVLVERVIRMVTDKKNPLPLNRLLLITFTKAAAEEVRTRVFKRLTDLLEENPDDLFLSSQLSLINQAQISTVHSFCKNLINDNFQYLDLPLQFTIADDAILKTLKNNSVDEVFDELAESDNEDFAYLCENFGGKFDNSNLKDIVIRLFDFSESLPYPKKWLEDVSKMYIDNNQELWEHTLIDNAKENLAGVIKQYEDILEILKYIDSLKAYYNFFGNELFQIKEIYSELENYKKRDTFYFKKLASFSFERLVTVRGDYDKIASEKAKGIRNNAKKELAGIYDELIYKKFGEELTTSFLKSTIVMLCKIVNMVSERFKSAKEKFGMLDFNDLLHNTITLLTTDETITNRIRNRYDQIMVDEYQDTNGIQAEIFDKISNGKNLFMVGDVKQSIYGFINADPEYFIKKLNMYLIPKNEDGVSISLANNFRSAKNILEFINLVFEKIMTQKTCGIDYTNNQQLIYSNKDVDSNFPVSVNLIEKDKTEYESDIFDDDLQTSTLHNEAVFTAKKILELMNNDEVLIFDKDINKKRKLRFSDIAIITRKSKDTSLIISNVLMSFGIPVFTKETEKYFDTVEISTVIEMLKLIDNPFLDISLVAAIRSPLFSFSDELLAKIRISNKKVPFYKAFYEYDDEKVKHFTEYFSKLRFDAEYKSIEEILREIIFDSGYYSFVGNMPDGKIRMANLRLLCQRAGEFEKSEHKTINEYINYINSMIENNSEYSTAKDLDGKDDLVSVINIHKSKGLEYPCVFLIGCGGKFNIMDLSAPINFDKDLGIGTYFYESERNVKSQTLAKRAITSKKRKQLLAEEMRLLYVALTRAKNILYIVASVNDCDKFTDKWLKNINDGDYVTLKQLTYIDWIVSAIINKYPINKYKASDILSNSDTYATETKENELKTESLNIDVCKPLEYEYKYKNATNIPSKLSVSEIISNDSIVKYNEINVSIGKKDFSRAERGTIIHFVMQNLDLKKISDFDSISDQVFDMQKKRMLNEKQVEVIDINAILEFFESDMGKRMLKSNDVKREFRFCVEIDADLVCKDLSKEAKKEQVVIQGVIDCCFEENGKYIILDYKTGKMEEEYNEQLKIYSMCLEKMLGVEVLETAIYPLC